MRGVGGVRKSIYHSWLAKGLGLALLCWGFKGVQERFRRKRPAHFKSDQWHFHQDNAPVHYSTLVTDYLTKMGVKTVSQPPYSWDLAPCDFWLFPKLRGYRYETIEEMKEAVTKVINTLTQEDFHGAFQLLEWYKCIAAKGDYFQGDWSFVCVLSIKVPSEKSLENLNDPRTFKLRAYAKLNYLKWNFFWHGNCTYTKLICLRLNCFDISLCVKKICTCSELN